MEKLESGGRMLDNDTYSRNNNSSYSYNNNPYSSSSNNNTNRPNNMNSLNIVNLMHKKAIYRHHIDNNNNHKINLYHQTNIKINICNTTN